MDLLNESVVRDIIFDIETSQNRERREKEIKAFEIYSGNLKEHVENRLMKIYPKTYKSFSISDLNIVKKITDKLSKAYKTAPYRELDTDQETGLYSEIMKSYGSTRAWQVFDIYYNLHRHACMWFNYYQDEDENYKIILRPLAPFQFSRVVDKYGSTEVFIVNFPSNDLYETTDTDGRKSLIQDSHQDTDKCRRYAMWTKDQHVMVRYYDDGINKDGSKSCRIVYESINGNEDNVNDLGVIPAVFAQQGDNCALPIINPISEQAIEYNQQYSVMLTGSSLQTFGHLVLKHPASQNMPDEIYNSLFTYSRLPQEENGEIATELDYINPNPNLESQLKVLQDYGHQIITEHLGDGSQSVNGSDKFTSGLDRLIAMSDITNMVESNQQVYAKCENDLYLIIKSFYESINDFRFKSEALSVKYPKAKPIQSESEILANIEKKLTLGLIEKHEALLMLDPNMTEKAAKDKVKAVNLEKQQSVQSFIGDINANNEG